MEDLLRDLRSFLFKDRDKSRNLESSLMELLTELDRNILSPAGLGDSYFSARKLNLTEPYTPLSRHIHPHHSPYTGIEDYYY